MAIEVREKRERKPKSDNSSLSKEKTSLSKEKTSLSKEKTSLNKEKDSVSKEKTPLIKENSSSDRPKDNTRYQTKSINLLLVCVQYCSIDCALRFRCLRYHLYD